MKRIRSHMSPPGFTLVELMVVVAIIALLISILLPSLAKAREQAYQVKCGAHLHAIFKGIFYYTEDKHNGNGYLPQFSWLIQMYPGAYWASQVMPYVDVQRSRAGSRHGFFRCPADDEPVYRYLTGLRAGEETTETTKMLNDDPGGANSSNPFSSGSKGIGDHIEPVTYNGSCDSMQQGSWPGLPSTQEIPRRLVEIRQPYCFPLLTETKPRSGTYGCWRWASVLQSGQAGADPSWRRHYGGTNPNSNGSNWLFADGHVAWHSASYASKKLICCMDFGSQYNDRFTQYQSLRTAKQAICQ